MVVAIAFLATRLSAPRSLLRRLFRNWRCCGWSLARPLL